MGSKRDRNCVGVPNLRFFCCSMVLLSERARREVQARRPLRFEIVGRTPTVRLMRSTHRILRVARKPEQTAPYRAARLVAHSKIHTTTGRLQHGRRSAVGAGSARLHGRPRRGLAGLPSSGRCWHAWRAWRASKPPQAGNAQCDQEGAWLADPAARLWEKEEDVRRGQVCVGR